jgi:transcription initiation factor IIE alpha subunit
MAGIAMAMDAATIPVDPYVLDTLMRDLIGHDRRPSAYLVYLALLGLAGEGRVALSHAQLAARTGLSKRAVQDGLAHLARRRLIAAHRTGATEPGQYRVLTPWRR